MKEQVSTIEKQDLNKSDKESEKRIHIKIQDFSPSMKLVLNILENNRPLTQKEIARETHLPHRTVRYAINRLKQEGILEEREYFLDARQSLYQIKKLTD